MRAADARLPRLLLQHRCRGGMSVWVWVGEDRVDHWVEGTKGGEDGFGGGGADGRAGGVCCGGGGGYRQGD